MKCSVCGTTDDGSFYKSIKGWCKDHWKEKVRANRKAKIDQYRERDRIRSSLPKRIIARIIYSNSARGREAHFRAKQRWQLRNKQKRNAHIAVGNAIRDGKLHRQPCEECGNKKTQAHHDDYSKPLEVMWLCSYCHSQRHKEIRIASLKATR